MQGEYPQEIDEVPKGVDNNLFPHDLLQIDFNPQENLSEHVEENKPRKKGKPKGSKATKAKIEEKPENSDKNKGHWDHDENKKYHWFLQIHSKHFIMKKLRRMDKIFKSMADFIGTREAEQCRSHHQKMQKKFNTFKKILKNLRNQFYLSSDPQYVKHDFQNNNITQYDPLLSEQLLEIQQQQQSNQQRQDKQQACQFQIPAKNNQNQYNILFSDHYQQEFRF